MDATEPHQRGAHRQPATRPPIEPLAPTPVERARGALGCALLTATMGVAVAVAIALALVVAAVIAITTLG